MAPAQKRPSKGRPRLPGGKGRVANKNKAVAYPADEKLKVLKNLAEYADIKRTIAEFYPNLAPAKFESRRTLILKWRLKRAAIEELCGEPGGANKKKARQVGQGAILPTSEEGKLVRWVNELREEGVPIIPTMLQIQAQDVAEAAGIAPFSASWSWQKGFKRRHRLSLRCKTRQGRVQPPDLARIAKEFAKEVKKKRLK